MSYEFSDITLKEYINYSQPTFLKQIDLFRQFLQSVITINNNSIFLDPFNLNLIFVENLNEPQLKILYTNGVIIYQENNDSCNIKKNIFFWLISVLFYIFTNSPNFILNQHENNILIFDKYDSQSKDILCKLFKCTLEKLQNNDTCCFSLQMFVDIFNQLLDLHSIVIISDKIIDKIQQQKALLKAEIQKPKNKKKLRIKSKEEKRKKHLKKNVTIVNKIEQNDTSVPLTTENYLQRNLNNSLTMMNNFSMQFNFPSYSNPIISHNLGYNFYSPIIQSSQSGTIGEYFQQEYLRNCHINNVYPQNLTIFRNYQHQQMINPIFPSVSLVGNITNYLMNSPPNCSS